MRPTGDLLSQEEQRLSHRLGLFDTTMIVMGGIIASGMFVHRYVVARAVHTPALILWTVVGLAAFLEGEI